MEKIAVVGLSCLFPGAKTPQEFWQNLKEQKDSRSLATPEKMKVPVEDFYDPQKRQKEDKFYCRHGGYVHDFEMDPTGFQIPAELIQQQDDVVQWSLHVAREALKDAGYWGKAEALARCGVVLGNLSFPTKSSNYLFLPMYHKTAEFFLQELLQDKDFHLAPFAPEKNMAADNGRISGYPAAMVARALATSGVHLSLDAACASSLYSVKLACDYLQARKTDMMLAGAVSAADPLFVHFGFSIFQAYPEEGSPSAPLDNNSGGLVAGEGAGMFVLKRYDDALRDGDHIHAVILGIGLSNDGRGQSVLSPNPKGQIIAFERAYADADLAPRNIRYVECHATGTPLGDKVELNSMDAFFGKHGAAPMVGSVKSNLGHLLTAAGMASMTKVILGMGQGVIPATINLKEPQSSSNQVIGPQQIPQSSQPWPDHEGARCAAVSAFGFGGTNAHIILEQGQDKTPDHVPQTRGSSPDHDPGDAVKPCPLAIVSMDALFGSCNGLSDFHRTTYEGIQHFIPLPAERWKGIDEHSRLLRSYGLDHGQAPRGAYIESFDLDFLHFRIPPNEDDRLIPQQLLTLKVADNALQEAQVEPGDNIAVIVAMETELEVHQMRGRVNLSTQLEASLAQGYGSLSPDQRKELTALTKNSIHNVAQANQYTSFIGNIMAARIAASWDFSGPAFTVSSEENSVFKALEVAQMMLDRREVEAVLLGAVDLAGGAESVLWRNSINRGNGDNRGDRVNTGQPTLSFDKDSKGWMIGEGAGAVVLKRLDVATQNHERVYACIDSLGLSEGISREAVAQACHQACENAGVQPDRIGYLEVSGSGFDQEDEAEITGLLQAYRASGRDLQTAIGSVKANIGHTYAASGMASLIKTALCLYHRFLPTTPAWSGPKFSEMGEEGPFYVPRESKTWFLEDQQSERVAAISGLGHDGTATHVILSEAPTRTGPARSFLTKTPLCLFPLTGKDQNALDKKLDRLQKEVLAGTMMPDAAQSCFEETRDEFQAAFGLALVSRNKDEVIQEIEAARKGMTQAFATGQDWASLRGSYFTARPQRDKGKLAFVYPGGFNSYIGLGRDFFQLFPQIHDRARDYSSTLERMVGDRLLYPRSVRKLTERELKDLEKDLINTPIAMFESGILFSILYTRMIRDCFKIDPQLALGYSMGEVSMWYALGAWDSTDEMSRFLRSSPVFQTRLAGPMETVRQAWNLPPAQSSDDKIWYGYVLRTSPAQAREAVKDEDRAYLIFVNSPKEVAIAGDQAACQRVVEKLGCEHFDLAMSDVIHCDLVRADCDELVRLHTQVVNQVTGIDFYSADTLAPVPVDSVSIAKNIANIYCREIDFERLIRQAHNDGARIFLELGPRELCTNWIKEILDGQEHLAVAVNRKGADEKTSIINALAKLFSHRVDLDLALLYQEIENPVAPKRSLVRATSLGGPRIGPAILSQENKERFSKKTLSTAPQAAAPRPATPPAPEPRLPHTGERSPVAPSPPARVAPLPPTIQERDQGTMKPSRTDSVPPAFEQFDYNLSLLSSSHAAFLQARRQGMKQIGEMVKLQMTLAAQTGTSPSDHETALPPVLPPTLSTPLVPIVERPPLGPVGPAPEPEGTLTLEEHLRRYPPPDRASAPETKAPGLIWDYADLREFAEGKIAPVFGDKFQVIDNYRRRVRLPMEPYLLVTRVTKLDAEPEVFKPCSLTTEYDIPYQAWYSIDGQIPWAVAVESGQCDLLLISYLGIDFECKGDRVYRLLDCTLTFLEDVPQQGDTLRYDIKINSFARSGGPLLFFFSYDCYVKDKLIIEMRGGCAGFFTDEELEAGKGIIYTDEDIEKRAKIPKQHFAPLLNCDKQSFDRREILQVVHDNEAACFGPSYDRQGRNPHMHLTAEAMLMMDRVVSVDPQGGPWGLGLIVAEKDLAPDHWYLPCHFKDDQVLAGSLVAEGCGQLMRFFMLHLGLQTRTNNARFQPIPRLPQKVRCRGQIIPKDRMIIYRMEIKEIGTEPEPYAIADVDILLEDKIVVDFKDLGVVLAEMPASELASLQTGSDPAPEKQVPIDKDEGALFTKYHLVEFATGSIANCFGPEFSFYDDRQPPRTPNGDLQLISRVLETKGKRMEFKKPASVVAEYDVPEDAWFFTENSHPAVMPYSIFMEIALQPNGFVSAWMGTTLIAPDTDFCFRNLDGQGTILRPLDLRGKTITNFSELLSTVTTGNTMIQQFRFEMSHEGEPFYKGTAVFGYFLHSALANQIGLDGGISNDPLQTKEFLSGPAIVHLDLKAAAVREQLYQAKTGKPFYHLASPQLDFLDEVHIVEQGGKYGKGYICGYKKIDPSDWFYPCHFYQDPVMPGSLGVESILQAMQIFALQQDLGRSFKSPYFTQHLNHRINWKYRGQLIPTDDQMVIEVHIKEIENTADKALLFGDANLWKNDIRIYEITDAAICLQES